MEPVEMIICENGHRPVSFVGACPACEEIEAREQRITALEITVGILEEKVQHLEGTVDGLTQMKHIPIKNI